MSRRRSSNFLEFEKDDKSGITNFVDAQAEPKSKNPNSKSSKQR